MGADHIDRRDLARFVMALFAKWDLTPEQQVRLLGLDPSEHRHLKAWQQGIQPLPKSPEVLDRVGHLASVHRCLRLLYPNDEQFRFGWVHYRNGFFDNEPPLAVMLRDGCEGIRRVAKFLDAQCHY